jgi:hypothetical protein
MSKHCSILGGRRFGGGAAIAQDLVAPLLLLLDALKALVQENVLKGARIS